MDTARFDSLSRRVSTLLTRRTLSGVLGLAAFGLPAFADAKKRRKKRHKKRRRRCAADPAGTTCARAGCGDQQNNCGQAVACPCPAGRSCLRNGTCAKPCTKASECDSACFAGCSNVTTENQQHCLFENVPGMCDNAQTCTSTAECPRGMHCQECPFMSGEYRCIAVCPD
jgi:hypothetical protein